MNIPRWSVTRPVAVTMRIAGLVLIGSVCLGRLPVDLLPNVSIPTVAINTTWPNVAPEEIEAQITRPIEEAVSGAPNMYTVTSSTVEGSSQVRVQFRWGTDVGEGAIDVLQLVERAEQNFPIDPTLQPPIVYKFDPSQLPILTYAVSGESDSVKLRTLLDNEITPILESADGVAAAVTTGGEQRAIMVDVDPNRLRAYGLSLNQVSNRIIQENLNVPAGLSKQGKTEFTIRSIGWFINPDEIAKIPIESVNGRVVTIGDVAKISDSHQETRLFTSLNNHPGAGIIITKQSGGNTVSTARAVAEKVSEIEKRYPELHFSIAYNQAEFIDTSIKDLQRNAMIGGFLAILILLFFLRNIRSTAVVALSIPISIFSSFALLYVCGFSLNTMSLGGLALATGLIADDAVVVLENIYRHFERDKVRPADAAIAGANEIMSAVMASTFTVIIVFLPLLLIKGQAGEMFTQFSLVVIFSISISLLDAMTVVPMLASRFISERDTHEDPSAFGYRAFRKFGIWFDALDRSYRNGLQWAIHHRFAIIGGAALITAASFMLLPYIGTEMLPPTDSGDYQLNLKLPPGTALSETNRVMDQIKAYVAADPNVQTAFAAVGSQLGLRGTSATMYSNQGAIQIKLKDKRSLSTIDDMAALRKKVASIPAARIQISAVDIVSRILTGGDTSVEADIYGPDLGTLSSLGKEITSQFKTIPGLENVDTNWQESEPELQWRIDRDKAVQHGVTFTDVSNTIDTATSGLISSYYQDKGFQYPIVVDTPYNTRQSVADLGNLTISPSLPGATSTTPVLLSQVANSTYGYGPSEITRQNRQRYIAVSGQPQGRSEGEVEVDMSKVMQNIQLPKGYYWEFGVAEMQRKDEFAGMAVSILLAIGLIYMLLAAQFESFVHPLTILCSVPASAVGVLLALFLTGRSFGLTALIGMLMLVGIVVKNGILLVDYTNVLRARGLGRDEAILRAGPTRLRPILMTTCATVLGMMPIAMALGKGSETNAPMATAVIGGLLTSTMLTLFLVPCVYTVFDDIGRKLRKDDRDLAEPIDLIEPTPASID